MEVMESWQKGFESIEAFENEKMTIESLQILLENLEHVYNNLENRILEKIYELENE